MYKEKYLKYKTKYLELKNQLDGISNTIQEGGAPDIQENGSILNIIDTINNVTLIINHNNQGLISIQTTKDRYNIWIDPSHDNFSHENNVSWDNMLQQLNGENKIIYKNLFLIAIRELTKKNLFNTKEAFISQLKHYITLLN